MSPLTQVFGNEGFETYKIHLFHIQNKAKLPIFAILFRCQMFNTVPYLFVLVRTPIKQGVPSLDFLRALRSLIFLYKNLMLFSVYLTLFFFFLKQQKTICKGKRPTKLSQVKVKMVHSSMFLNVLSCFE